MVKMIVTVGLPASGKSTYFNSLEDFIYISSDDIREKDFGDIATQDHNSEVFALMLSRTIENLKNGHNVYYDACNINRKRRIHLINSICQRMRGTEVEIEAIVFSTPYEFCLENNRSRERKIPEYVIKKMYMSFQVPSVDEGFDSVKLYNINPKFMETEDIDQENPHHSLALMEHLDKAADIAIHNDYNRFVIAAALHHDNGKPFCKTFKTRAGVEDNVAHYYNHANVGAYNFLTWKYFDNYTTRDYMNFFLHVALLIEYHMDFFAGENRLKKIKKLHGLQFYNELFQLHLCDILAH